MIDIKNIKLIATDLDGTLIKSNDTVGNYTKQVIDKIRNIGIKFTLSTGRMYNRTKHIAGKLEIEDFVVCLDGGYITNKKLETLNYSYMELQKALEVYNLLKNHSNNLYIIQEDIIYTGEKSNRDLIYPFGKNIVVTDIEKKFPPKPNTIITVSDDAAIRNLKSEIEIIVPQDKYNVYFSPTLFDGYFQIIVRRKNSTKGKGIEILAKHYGINMSEVLVFGDWLNDLSMFKVAGYSIAPKNAVDEVKKKATYVSNYSNEEEFLAKELEKLFLLKGRVI